MLLNVCSWALSFNLLMYISFFRTLKTMFLNFYHVNFLNFLLVNNNNYFISDFSLRGPSCKSLVYVKLVSSIGQCKTQTEDCRLRTADCRPRTRGKMQAECKMQTAD